MVIHILEEYMQSYVSFYKDNIHIYSNTKSVLHIK